MSTHPDKGIIHAITIEKDGAPGKPLIGDAISKAIKEDTLAWVHLDRDTPEAREWIERELTYLDSIIVDALLEQETRPRILEHDNGVLLILRGVNLNQDAEPEDMISIRLWIDPHRIVSFQLRPLKAVKDIHEKIQEGKGPKDAGDFTAALVNRLVERMDPVLTDLDENLDSIEEQIIENPDISERAKITDIRKTAIILRRYIAPQRDAISTLRTTELQWLEITHRRRLQETLDRLTRYTEDLDAIRERAAIVKDELASTHADRLNKNMYILSVIAAIFLPLGFLTGLLGINVGGIPGADNPAAFAIFCSILGVIVAAQIALFKKMKWF